MKAMNSSRVKLRERIEQCAVEIFVQGDLSGVKCRKREIVAVLKFFPIEVKSVCGFFS